jgi:hypothetical protein
MSTKYAYKELPSFDPIDWLYWQDVVLDAIAERGWHDYLVTPLPVVTPPVLATDGTTITAGTTTIFTPDPATSARVKAFLSQSIGIKHRSAIHGCTTAAEIWSVFVQRYGQRTRDDELRLEAELLSYVKLSSESLDDYIERFGNIISRIRAQQDAAQRWDDAKINMYFIRSLTLSQIPSEDWKGWSTYLGSTYRTMNYDQLLSACRTYYATYMVPFKAFQPQEFAFYAQSSPASPRPSQTGNNPGPSNEQGQPKGKRNNRGGGNSGSRRQDSDTTTGNTR